MAQKSKHIPNRILRRLREERGWSLQRVADELRLLAEAEDENRLPGVNANMVGIWERGWKRPSPFYQALFCQLYSRPASQLGFVRDEPAIIAPPSMRKPQTGTIQANPLPSLPQMALTHEQTRAIDLLCSPHEAVPDAEHQAGAWLTLGASGLSQLFNEGWSLTDILTSLQLVLQSMQSLPPMTRRRLLQLGGAAMISSLPMPAGEQVSEEERIQLTGAMGESIGEAWKLFHSANIQQVLAVGQAQLYLVQQAHSLIYPDVCSLFYSATYQLIGASLYFSGQYRDAQKALEQSYITALQGANVWHMAQSLSWQMYVLYALERYSDALHLADEALRIISQQQDRESIRLRARLFALSAEIAILKGDAGDMEQRLRNSQSLLKYIPGKHEEFDTTSWFQHAGTCALIQRHYDSAITHLQHALDELPEQWKYRYISTALPVAQAYTYMKRPEKALAIAEDIIPALTTTQSLLLRRKFEDYLHKDFLPQFSDNPLCQTFVATASCQIPLM